MKARLLEIARAALAAIEAQQRRIDDLNVYPVPDGDTGTNLALTVRAAVEALEASESDDRVTLGRELSRAALMGARGNSGVILSQIVRGATEVLARSDDLAAALRAASDTAYRAVRNPVEGTMLTAVRELAEEAERGSGPAAILARGEECVARTQAMLPVLAEAGVVDAGAAGLVEIFRGIAAALAGAAPPPAAPEIRSLPPRPGAEPLRHDLSRFTYCTGFVLEGDGLEGELLERALEQLGDSLLVVGDPSALKVHIHTDDPGRALSLAVRHGTIANVEISNMRLQEREREQRLLQVVPDLDADRDPQRACVVVAVVAGDGNKRLYESLGVQVVDGGRTMNPSIAELLAALEHSRAREAIVLPNSRNVVPAAEQAATASPLPATVVPTETVQAGLAAAVAFDPARSREENAAEMARAAASVGTGGVAIASRDLDGGGVAVRRGTWLGLAGGVPVAGGDSFDEVSRLVVERLLEQPRDVLTLLTGETPPPLEGLLAALAASHPELEVEVHHGGQPHYALLVGAE